MNASQQVRICPECGATINVNDTADLRRCWLCAYALTAHDLTQEPPRLASPYESIYRVLHLVIVGFVALVGVGELIDVLFLGGNLAPLVFYSVFVAIVFGVNILQRRAVSDRGQPIRSRERFLTLIGSLLSTIAIGVAIIVAIFIALFAACLSVISGGIR